MERKNLWVCARCLMGIESHEGRQATLLHSALDEDEEQGLKCDWCEDDGFDELFELI